MEQPINKFHNGKIYTIRSHLTDKFYIGSTRDKLYKRLSQHRANYRQYKNGKYHNVSSFIMLDYDDHYIELLEDFKCENKQQLEKREGELIRLHRNNCINKCMVGRTNKEYVKDNAEKTEIYQKQYQIDNKDKLAIYAKKYYMDNIATIVAKSKQLYICECGVKSLLVQKLRHEKSIKHTNYILLKS
jgi:hypothetical protein